MQTDIRERLAIASPRIATAMCALAFVSQLALFGRNLLESSGLAGAESGNAAPTVTTRIAFLAERRKSQKQLSSILEANLFGESQAAAATAPMEATQEPLELQGIIASNNPGQGFALLGAAAARSALVAVGSTGPGGLILREVYADHVVLDRGGKLEYLLLPRRSNRQGAPILLAAATTSTPGDQIVVAATTPGGLPTFPAVVAPPGMPDPSLIPPPGRIPPDQLQPVARQQSR
jgi:type II secretory pathway component PulC